MTTFRSAVGTPGAPGDWTMRRKIGPFQLFALAFGSIIGSSWVVLLGDWYNLAGPAGALIGFTAGGLVMMLICACYAELTARIPEAGGEFVYSLYVFGPKVAFLVGWFFTLCLLAITIFEAIALSWILQVLWPPISGPELYRVGGAALTLDGILVGLCGVLLITGMNYRGTQVAATFQGIITYGFIAVVVAVLGFGLWHGSPDHIQPLWESGSGQPWWHGAVWIFATSAAYLNGFQAIPQAIEERAPGVSLRLAARLMVGAVLAATLFYITIILTVSSIAPWSSLIGDEFAPVTALRHIVPSGLLGKILLLAAAFSILKTWNAVALMAARIIMAQARHGFLPPFLARTHKYLGSPANAILVVGIINAFGVFVGRSAILPLVTMASIAITIGLSVSCLALIRLRQKKSDQQRPEFSLPGGFSAVYAAFVVAILMALVAFIEPWLRADGSVPVECILLLLWAALGMIFSYFRRKKIFLNEANFS